MRSEWTIRTISDIADINPRESISKGSIVKKIPMEALQPFTRDISSFQLERFNGGSKFRNLDTIMARITPCLENGKIALVSCLNEGEVGFGSTEYIVFRAKEGTDPYFLYYLICSPLVRDPAIKSMVGSSGRQRVQTDVVENLQIAIPDYCTQKKIGEFLKAIDDKIHLNTTINKNLLEQAQTIYTKRFITDADSLWPEGKLSDLIEVCYGKDHKQLHDGDIPVYGSGGIMRHVDRALYEQESVLVPRKGTLNNVMYVDEPFWSVDTMFFTKMKRQNVAKFVFHFLKGKDLASMNAGSAVPSMTTKILNAIPLQIPDDQTLSTFEAQVSPFYQAASYNNKESENLATIRDSLLPKLMSGEIDVSNIDL
jgi:type I restriction enzyme S subunit